MQYCTQFCAYKINENEFRKNPMQASSEIFNVKVNNIILIQSIYRGYKARIKYKKMFLQSKQKQITKNNSNIYYKENWEYFFKFKQRYNFSAQGIKTLEIDIINFYVEFFKGNLNTNLSNSQRRTIQSANQRFTFKRESVSTLKEITDEKLTIYTQDIIKSISDCSDFLSIFKYYFLSILRKNFEIGNQEDSIEGIKFEFCTVEGNKNFEIQIDGEEVRDSSSKETLIEDKKPFINTIIKDVENYEKTNCTILSFLDSNDVYYFGSLKNNSFIKWGLGKEYFIELNGIQSERFKYCGYFKKGQYHGLGMYVQENNVCYYGEYRNGCKCGYGILETFEYTYTGFFYNNKFEGYGEYSTQSLYYSGGFHDGLFDGFGYMETDNNSICVGCFSKGKINGEACYKWNDGHMYYGSWVDGKMHGYGEFYWKKGDKYFGHYEKDLKHGKGIYYYKNGSKLEGNWVEGKKEGKFKFTLNEDNDLINMKKGVYPMIYKMDIQVK